MGRVVYNQRSLQVPAQREQVFDKDPVDNGAVAAEQPEARGARRQGQQAATGATAARNSAERTV